jgi:hypothetical protein
MGGTTTYLLRAISTSPFSREPRDRIASRRAYRKGLDSVKKSLTYPVTGAAEIVDFVGEMSKHDTGW